MRYLPDNVVTVDLHDGRKMNKVQLIIEACILNNYYNRYTQDTLPDSTQWSIRSRVLWNVYTYNLFGTFLLSIQKLEEQGVIELAHQAMIEDIFTSWTLGDEYLLELNDLH